MLDSPVYWYKTQDVVVNSLTLNQDTTLITLATSKGYRIFDTCNMFLLSNSDDRQNEIGNINLATSFYKSHIVCFCGGKDNILYLPTQLILWDDYQWKKLGVIHLKETIMDFKISKNLIYVIVPYRIFLFEILTLKYVTSIEDVKFDPKLYCVSYTNPSILAYVSWSNSSIVKINKYLIGDNKVISSTFQMMLVTDFFEIQVLQISTKGDLLVVSSFFGNKIHIYSLRNYELQICIFLGQTAFELGNICLDRNSKFMLFLANRTTLSIFNIRDFNGEYACECDDHDDEKILTGLPAITSTNQYSFFRFFTNISKSIFEDVNEPFCMIEFDNPISRCYQISFDLKKKDELVCYIILHYTLVESTGDLRKLKFDRKSPGLFAVASTSRWIYETMKYS